MKTTDCLKPPVANVMEYKLKVLIVRMIILAEVKFPRLTRKMVKSQMKKPNEVAIRANSLVGDVSKKIKGIDKPASIRSAIPMRRVVLASCVFSGLSGYSGGVKKFRNLFNMKVTCTVSTYCSS